jgi:transposase-like protein
MSRAKFPHPRGRRAREEIERLLRAYDSSGLTQTDFARTNRMSVATLRYWLRRRRDEAGGAADARPALIPVTLRPSIGGIAARIEIVLGNGRELRLPIDTDTTRVRSLVSALES